MGIRLPLDASPGDLLKLVIGKAMRTVQAGLVLGGGAALALRVLVSLLYNTSPTDRVGGCWGVADRGGAFGLLLSGPACDEAGSSGDFCGLSK